MTESSRGTPFPDRVRTRIWQEEPHPENPFLAQQARCHGYALDEMARTLEPAETLFLLLRGELPNEAQKSLLRRLMTVCCNPGPRHEATRAVINAAASGTHATALPAIGLALLSGAHLGAAEVEQSARFITRHWREDPVALAQRLASGAGRASARQARDVGLKPDLQEVERRIAPGFGTLAGEIDPLSARLVTVLLEVAATDGPLAWAARFAAAVHASECGWLMPGVAAAACCELGFAPNAAALVYQYASLPGLIAHALEYCGKGIASLPFIADERYEMLDQQGQRASVAGDWNALRGRIRTRKGGWRIGGGITVHGRSLLDELVGRHSFTEVLFLEVTGRMPEARLARWIEASFLCLSFPDPRIWCNQIGALAGSARVDPTIGISAGVMASDSNLYGPGATSAACAFLLAAHAAQAAGETLGDFLARHTTRTGRLRAPGFARPIAKGDDRVAALARIAQELRYEDGPFVRLAWQIDARILAGGGSDGINMLGYVAAFLLDRGLAIEEGERLYALCVNAGVHACYAEAASEAPGAFLPLAVEDIEYTGVPARALPGMDSTP